MTRCLARLATRALFVAGWLVLGALFARALLG